MNKKSILYVRSGPYKVNLHSYNLQEVGFSKELCKKGFNCDIIYYSNENRDECIFEYEGRKVTILWRKGFKIFRTGIYPTILKKEFLKSYDYIISTEYSQIMTFLLSKLSKNVILYSGPYYNMFKIPIISKIYDCIFTKSINKNIKYKFVKSVLAKEFLENKGYTNIQVLGVGLDINKFNNVNQIENEIKDLINYMKKNKCILYVGSLEDRKNFDFTLRVFQKINSINKEIKLIIIGKGNKKYVNSCFSQINDKAKDNIIHLNQIKNKYLKNIYENADLFILPSKVEIFGMVLLEAMYFGVPCITSKNGGSCTLIENSENGIIIENFDEKVWKEEIINLLENDIYCEKLKNNAKNTILERFTWERIVEKFLENIIC